MASDLSVLHPDLRQSYRRLPKLALNKGNWWLIQGMVGLMRATKAPADVRVENLRIPNGTEAKPLRLRTYRPATPKTPTPALVWIHGGGFVMGKPEMDDRLLMRFAREVGICVVSIDYRLAPLHPFPQPLEDCYTGLRWVFDHADQLGIDPQRIAIGEGSAGGGLAATLAQMAHDRAEVPVVFQLLVYPMLNDRTVLRSSVQHEELMIWSPANNRFGWSSYLHQPPGAATTPPYGVAARRPDVAGLPPAWIGVGTLDLFYDEDVAYAHRLQESGVACELVEIPGAFHGFDALDTKPQVTQTFHAAQIAALQQHLHTGDEA